MSIAIKITLFAILVLSILIPFGAYFISKRTKSNYKASLAFNVLIFFGTMLASIIFMYSGNAQAAEVTPEVSNAAALGFIGAALSTGLSCIGGGIAVASAASAALGAISEDSTILGKSLIFVGLAEGVCLYGLIISFMILGKL